MVAYSGLLTHFKGVEKMEKLYFKVENREQRNALDGLAYHVADVNYILERYGAKDPEYKKAHENVLLTFKHLDALGVPFWVQNSVVCFAENWRQYKNNYMDSWLLKHRNIDIKVS